MENIQNINMEIETMENIEKQDKIDTENLEEILEKVCLCNTLSGMIKECGCKKLLDLHKD